MLCIALFLALQLADLVTTGVGVGLALLWRVRQYRQTWIALWALVGLYVAVVVNNVMVLRG